MKILVAVDGSKYTRRVLDYLISHRSQWGARPEVTLLNVQYALPPHIASSLGRRAVAAYYADESRKALAVASRRLDRAGMAYQASALVGEPGTTIADQATRGKFDLVLMGSHGHTALANLVLGSCTTKVMSQCRVPVTVIR